MLYTIVSFIMLIMLIMFIILCYILIVCNFFWFVSHWWFCFRSMLGCFIVISTHLNRVSTVITMSMIGKIMKIINQRQHNSSLITLHNNNNLCYPTDPPTALAHINWESFYSTDQSRSTACGQHSHLFDASCVLVCWSLEIIKNNRKKMKIIVYL